MLRAEMLKACVCIFCYKFSCGKYESTNCEHKLMRLAQFQDARKNMTSACHKEILIGLNEDSVRARKLRTRSTTPVKTTSRLHVITNNMVEKTVPDRKYDDYHGSTRNDMLTLVALPPYELAWNLPLKDKIAVYQHAEGTRRINTSCEACVSCVIALDMPGCMICVFLIAMSHYIYYRLQKFLSRIMLPSRFSMEASLRTCGRTSFWPTVQKV